MFAALLTIGNELVSGDVPDELEAIVYFVRREAPRVDHLVVTGSLGGTPDDITREALASAFGVPQENVPELEADLRGRFTRDPDYAARWALLPQGAEPLENPRGGAPGFRIANVWVLPGLPSEMEAMFDRYGDAFRAPAPIERWRRFLLGHGESDIAHLLVEATERWPAVLVGSYPRFLPDRREVEVVLKAADEAALAEASGWLADALDTLG